MLRGRSAAVLWLGGLRKVLACRMSESSHRLKCGTGSKPQVPQKRAAPDPDPDLNAGKLTHSGAAQLSGSDYSLADYNRAGVPLLEIVSEPDMRTGAEAAAYGAEIRRIVRFVGASNGNMQVGRRASVASFITGPERKG